MFTDLASVLYLDILLSADHLTSARPDPGLGIVSDLSFNKPYLSLYPPRPSCVTASNKLLKTVTSLDAPSPVRVRSVSPAGPVSSSPSLVVAS